LNNLAQGTTTNANGRSQNVRTLPVAASPHGGSEPNAEVLNSCCERTQHENLLRRREVAAASQREMRPFRQYAANLKP
jgi:hypothetical protein